MDETLNGMSMESLGRYTNADKLFTFEAFWCESSKNLILMDRIFIFGGIFAGGLISTFVAFFYTKLAIEIRIGVALLVTMIGFGAGFALAAIVKKSEQRSIENIRRWQEPEREFQIVGSLVQSARPQQWWLPMLRSVQNAVGSIARIASRRFPAGTVEDCYSN